MYLCIVGDLHLCIGPFDCTFDINTCNGQRNVKKNRKSQSLRLRLPHLTFLYNVASNLLVCYLCLSYVSNSKCVSWIPFSFFFHLFRPKIHPIKYDVHKFVVNSMFIRICLNTLLSHTLYGCDGMVWSQHRDTTLNLLELQCHKERTKTKNLPKRKRNSDKKSWCGCVYVWIIYRIYVLHSKWISFWFWVMMIKNFQQ